MTYAFSYKRLIYFYPILFFVLLSVLSHIPHAEAYLDRNPPQDCASCHNGSRLLNILSFNETSLDPDTIYTITLQVSGPANAGSDVYTLEINNGAGLPVGVFVQGPADDTVVSSNVNRLSSNGFIGERFSSFQGNRTYYWKSPSTLNEGVRIIAEVVDGNGSNSPSGDRIGSHSKIVGTLVIPQGGNNGGGASPTNNTPPPFVDFDPNADEEDENASDEEVRRDASSGFSSGETSAGGCGVIQSPSTQSLPIGWVLILSGLLFLVFRQRKILK